MIAAFSLGLCICSGVLGGTAGFEESEDEACEEQGLGDCIVTFREFYRGSSLHLSVLSVANDPLPCLMQYIQVSETTFQICPPLFRFASLSLEAADVAVDAVRGML